MEGIDLTIADDQSYVINCIIKPRCCDKGKKLFSVDWNASRFIVKLDGYAIIPKEEYELLKRGKLWQM